MHDISSIDGVSRNQEKMEMLIRSLARNESSVVSSRKLINDISGESLTEKEIMIGKNTITDYLDVLQKLYITDNILAYSSNYRSPEKVGVSVKRHFTDPSLAAALYHFRNNVTGLEVDAIIEMPSGEYGAIEIKLGTESEDRAAENLLKFSEDTDKKPSFLAVINGLGQTVVKRPDGVFVVPITSLRD